MSINWVMLTNGKPATFTPLPHEQTLYSSPPRNSLVLQSNAKFPAHQPYNISSSSGTLHLTNRRLIYLPATPTPTFQSFAASLLNLHDSHVTAPWIGPNVWVALVQPVQGGGLPTQHAALEVKITFKEGGAYDFHTKYEQVRERMAQAVEVARASGAAVGDGSETTRGRGGGVMEAVNVDSVHLDELPAYEEREGGRTIQPQTQTVAATQTALGETQATRPTAQGNEVGAGGTTSQQPFSPPNEPPPNYEDVQREVVEDEFSRRLDGADPRREQ